MKLTGKLKSQVEDAATREEKKMVIQRAGMLLTDDELDMVTGGWEWISPQESMACPYCGETFSITNGTDLSQFNNHHLNCPQKPGNPNYRPSW